MNGELRRKLQINGVTYYLAVNQYGPGAPTVETPGKPAVLYMDTDTGDLYKCTAADVKAGVYTWKPLLGELAQELEDLKKTGYVRTVNGIAPDENGNVKINTPESGGNADQSGLTAEQITALDNMFKICAYTADATNVYAAFLTAFGIGGEVEPDEPDTEKTLTSISATYSGGDVTAGTVVDDLTGIVVTAHYSDGTSEAVTGYTLSGTIAEGSNTVTVSYGGKNTTFVVTGVAESGGEESDSENIVTSTTWTFGSIAVDANNAMKKYDSTSWKYSDWIPVPTGKSKLIWNATGPLRQTACYFFAERSDDIVGAIPLGSGGGYVSGTNASYPSPIEVDIPSGTNYVVLNTQVAGLNNNEFVVVLE